jgi:glycosyltransferase involved in cell wall biosynthesis
MKDHESNLKFTVIIPTRERCDTLHWSLKTCTSQNYENLEIIVSDNFSQDATRDVVEAYRDSRIRYINTGERLSMSHNWEFALAHATGDYVAYVGDDDGLMPNAIEPVLEVINETNTDAFICKKPLYYWPNHLLEEYRNILVLYTDNTFEKINSGEMLKKMTQFDTMEKSPVIYDGFIRREVLEKIKRMSGRFFNSQIPDVYSAAAILGVIPDYYYTRKPFLIQGISGHSTGASYLTQGGGSKSAVQFYSEENIPFHPKMRSAPEPNILVAESLLQAQENVETDLDYSFDPKVLLQKAMENAVAMSPKKYDTVVEAVEFIGESNQVRDHAAEMIAKNTNSPAEEMPFQMGYNFLRNTLGMRLNENKVSDIYHASLECERIRNNLSTVDYIKNSGRYIMETAARRGILGRIGKAFSSFITRRSS